jgi:hypothetical protein
MTRIVQLSRVPRVPPPRRGVPPASSHVTTVLSRPAPTSHTLGLSTETFSR